MKKKKDGWLQEAPSNKNSGPGQWMYMLTCARVCIGRLCFLLLTERGQVDQLEQRDQPSGHHCQQRDSVMVVAKEYEE